MVVFHELPTDQRHILKDEDNSSENDRGIALATGLSWIGNWVLLILKICAFILSNSKAILALAVDSVVDLISQFVLILAASYMKRHSPDYPVGRSGLEALSVLVCACIMTFISIEIIQFSMVDILNGINGDLSPLKLDLLLYVMIFICMILKSVLFMICSYTNLTARNDMLLALTEDHFNDVISNSGAIITAAIAFNTTAWWADPGGAILISIIIIYRWTRIMTDQVKKLLGHIAPPHFILKIEGIARLHDSRLAVNCTRAYHFGAKYNVEMEITLPGSMMIFDLQDITLALKQKLEAVGDVERAFIIVGHQIRNDLEQNI